jgi:hypothetical protein
LQRYERTHNDSVSDQHKQRFSGRDSLRTTVSPLIERWPHSLDESRLIVPQGVTHTPKQIHLDKDGGKLYWCDREGMRVMRGNLDGSQVGIALRY